MANNLSPQSANRSATAVLPDTACIMSEYTIVDIQQVIAGAGDTTTTTGANLCAAVAPVAQLRSPQTTSLMNSSIVSSMDDSTPSDSGVQLLDSVSSMNESLMSGSGFDFDLTPSSAAAAPAVDAAAAVDSAIGSPVLAAVLDAENANANASPAHIATEPMANSAVFAGDEMKTSVCSTFDADAIVYRRKPKKPRQPSSASGAKKRVSFHEDILNSTKTDNIHIEHGFITYKGGPLSAAATSRRQAQAGAGRYSWCSDGAGRPLATSARGELDDDDDEEYAENGQYYYRNACSDVLDYGKTELYEQEMHDLQADRSGVFEYGPPPLVAPAAANGNAPEPAATNADAFYKCNCSSSNSSLQSDDSGSAASADQANGNAGAQSEAQRNYGQAKSNSCDCIGSQQPQQQQQPGGQKSTAINENCYFSEPNIERLDDNNRGGGSEQPTKSVWSKEKKPKSSCLKSSQHRYSSAAAGGVPIQNCALSRQVKSFNVHQKLVPDRSKNLFGSLKQIFTMPLPERGVPEGCEDLHSVFECVPEAEHCSPAHKQPTTARAFLSKSFDGGLAKSGGGGGELRAQKYVHNVDQQLRHNTVPKSGVSPVKSAESRPRPEALVATTTTGAGSSTPSPVRLEVAQKSQSPPPTAVATANASPSSFRNKYIINCESTVFEHTGVSYEADSVLSLPSSREQTPQPAPTAAAKPIAPPTPPPPVPFRKKLTNILRNAFRDAEANQPQAGELPAGILPSPSDRRFAARHEDEIEAPEELVPHSDEEHSDVPAAEFKVCAPLRQIRAPVEPRAVRSSPKRAPHSAARPKPIYDCVQYNVAMCLDAEQPPTTAESGAVVGQLRAKQQSPQPASPQRSRHLISPMRNKTLTTRFERSRMSPDLFGGSGGGGGHRDSKASTLSDEFDDILTITTTESSMSVVCTATATAAAANSVSDANTDTELVIVDYPDQQEFRAHVQQAASCPAGRAMPASMTNSTASSSKSSLINRFLRNVTQKKIADATIQKNTFLASKVRSERTLCESLWVKGVRPRNRDLIEDLNAEIALEMEMSGCAGVSVGAKMQQQMQQQQQQQQHLQQQQQGRFAEFGLGVGEIAADLFASLRLPILRDDREQLMKVFKLYTGYSLEGHMTPVLVFLTDKTLYVTDLLRSRLFNRFVLPYTELDVILIGPHGNTVLLSNSARDMQQVLLAGGPYPADGLVSSLEMCARRGGSVLPAVGQLTLDHLAPLQQFVRDNSAVAKNDPWIYYAVVSVPANLLNHDAEPLGPHIKGPLMFRGVTSPNAAQQWQAGYFLLKAGVLYMFNDAQHRIPSLVIGMYECKGARRAPSSSRPHCFELMLKTGFMQLAAPDEYVASDWLQALVQAASGLFEMQERHKALGCTLVLTSNHLITLREDFTAPLRRVNSAAAMPAQSPRKLALDRTMRKLSAVNSAAADTAFNDTSSNRSSSISTARYSDSRRSSAISSPARSDDGRSPRRLGVAAAAAPVDSVAEEGAEERSSTSMSSIYGKNSGVEIKTCAALLEISSVRIPAQGDNWWCILEFTCQEVRENSDDMVVFFATNSDMRRFLTMLETLWQSKNDSVFPLHILTDEDAIGSHCSDLFMDINKSWDPLISAALGHPQ